MKTYLVTGASSGIGAVITSRLLQRGDRVIGLGRRPYEGASSERFEWIEVDFRDRARTEAILATFKRSNRTLDGVISNAGVGLFGQLENHSGSQIFDVLDVNLTSHILLARATLPSMKARGQGTFVFMGSEAAHQGRRNGSVYCATKAAIKSFAQALRQDVANRGVRVSVINPGMVDTPFFDALPFRPGREDHQHLKACQVAETVCAVLDASEGIVFDEVSISPQVNVVAFESKRDG